MVDKKDIIAAAAEALGDGEAASAEKLAGEASGDGEGGSGSRSGLFLVEVRMAGDEVEVFIDSDARDADGRMGRVSVEDCISLTRAIESRFDRDADDFSLTVSSAGIGQPLRHPRQYKKLVGQSVEVVTTGGARIVGTLEAAGDGAITLSYPEKQKTEGARRPVFVTVTKAFPLTEIKTTKEYIDFK
ncbi:MAG: ribosome assembly cofactor RimP [Alistipes sp.]|jgi:ribosome maturation factor RimP|nr:ribosome assembly cofactor RimP [Alistipes sp.]